jgi:NADPH-dependent 2,4-dienoyl-CoA reductase/sulfur reductase-like enzyme/rhodanese-related sulfurtransferase
MSKKVIIVGGVAGGATAAARLRRLDEKANIIMFEKGEYISFANCGLPYYVGDAIKEREALILQTPEMMMGKFNMDIRVLHEVLSIEKEQKSITVKNLANGEIFNESYDELILSPGSLPLKPPIPGIDSPNIFTLWTIPDVDKIKDYVIKNNIKNAVVIGGGFIGIEMAENFHDLGIEVTIVEMLDQVMAPIDFEMASIVHHHMKEKGVNLILSDGVKSFEYVDGKTNILLSSGKIVNADIVMLSIGVRPQSELAKAAGLEIGPRGHIVVDEYLKTNDDNIYAIGDAIEVVDYINKTKTAIPLAGPANKQGRIVANNILGYKKEVYKGTQGTSIAKVFDLTVASTGHNEKILKRNNLVLGKDYQKVIIHSKHHVTYYPGSEPMTIKALFTMDGKVLGAQIVGLTGVDKRIDVIAAVIRMNGTIDDLRELELAYAPPYNSAKDPVNMVGFTAENLLDGTLKFVNYDTLSEIQNPIYLDVRNLDEVQDTGKVTDAIHIPLGMLRKRLSELDPTRNYIVYCAIGVRGYIATRILMQNGFENVYNFSGGYDTYSLMNCMNDSSLCSGFYHKNVDFSELGVQE